MYHEIDGALHYCSWIRLVPSRTKTSERRTLIFFVRGNVIWNAAAYRELSKVLLCCSEVVRNRSWGFLRLVYTFSTIARRFSFQTLQSGAELDKNSLCFQVRQVISALLRRLVSNKQKTRIKYIRNLPDGLVMNIIQPLCTFGAMLIPD